MIGQLGYNSILYLIGYLFLVSGFPLPKHLRYSTAYFFGMALWAVVSTFLIIFSIKICLPTVLSICLAIILLISFFNRDRLKETDRLEFIWFPIYFTVFILINIALFHYNPIVYQPDSIKYIGMGLDIGRSGYFPPPDYMSGDIKIIKYFLQGRMVFLPVIMAGSHLFGVDFYHTIFPLSAVCFLPVFAILFFIATEPLNLKKSSRLLLGVLGALMIVSVPAYLFHAYYINNNLLVSIFFSISILSIFIYRGGKDRTWLFVAAFTLGVTVLQRTEMSFFSVIPIAMLISSRRLERRDYGMFLLIFLSIAFSWHLYKMSYLGLGKYYHEWGLLQLATYSMYILSYFIVHFETTKREIAHRAPEILISVLMILIIFPLILDKQGALYSISNLFLIITTSQGVNGWGAIWLLIMTVTVIEIAVIKKRNCDFWIQTLIIFFAMRILLYSSESFLKGANSVFHSGSRILLHILPIGVFFVFYLLANILSDMTPTEDSVIKR